MLSKSFWKCCVLFAEIPNAIGNVAFCSQRFQKLLEMLRSIRRASKYSWKCCVLFLEFPKAFGNIAFYSQRFQKLL